MQAAKGATTTKKRETPLSSGCSTSSLVWKLEKLVAVNNDEEARNSLVIQVLDKLIGLAIGQVTCRQQRRRRKEKLPCH